VKLTNCTGFVPKDDEKGENPPKVKLTNCTGFVPKDDDNSSFKRENKTKNGKKVRFQEHEENEKKNRLLINPLEHKGAEIENTINAVEEGWEFMSILIDSGSTETVAPSKALAGYELVSTDWSETGKGYSAANGTDIPNLGEKIVKGQTATGMWCTMRFQICDVTKPLGSVSRICQAGSRVVFAPPEEGSYIEHVKSGKRSMLRQCKGLYFLDMWISPSSGFTRPGNM
jgi:hypothetical protein